MHPCNTISEPLNLSTILYYYFHVVQSNSLASPQISYASLSTTFLIYCFDDPNVFFHKPLLVLILKKKCATHMPKHSTSLFFKDSTGILLTTLQSTSSLARYCFQAIHISLAGPNPRPPVSHGPGFARSHYAQRPEPLLLSFMVHITHEGIFPQISPIPRSIKAVVSQKCTPTYLF